MFRHILEATDINKVLLKIQGHLCSPPTVNTEIHEQPATESSYLSFLLFVWLTYSLT